MPTKPLVMLLLMLAGWINRQQQDVIDYLKEENKILREKLGKKRVILNDDQRRRLAIKGKTLGRRLLEDICCVFSPDMILKWHRRLVAQKYDGSKRRRKAGRPRIARTLEDLIVRIASENPSWGYYRIEGQIKILGYSVSRTQSCSARSLLSDLPAYNTYNISPGFRQVSHVNRCIRSMSAA